MGSTYQSRSVCLDPHTLYGIIQFFQKDDASRFYIFNTLFNLPEIYVIASMIDLYESLGTSLTLCDLKKGRISVFPRFHP